MNFINESKPETRKLHLRNQGYGFDRAPKLLFQWSRPFQSVVSQSGTFLLTGKFHTGHCSIHKSEGGCIIAGVGDLVLGDEACYFDHGSSSQTDKENKLCQLITDIVLKWNPNDPIESMLLSAAEHAGCSIEALRAAVNKSTNGGVFGGDALSDFFGWNPFSDPPIDRTYERWCLTKFSEMTDAQVDQKYADEDLGKELLLKLQSRVREQGSGCIPMCCSPRRGGNGLAFWINTGWQTQIDGWKTEAEINRFLSSGERIKGMASY